jgi:hypothetical protein
MAVNQVVFIMLAYNLLQFYLLHRGRKELNQKTPPHIRQQLLPSDNHIIVHYQNYYAMFAPSIPYKPHAPATYGSTPTLQCLKRRRSTQTA